MCQLLSHLSVISPLYGSLQENKTRFMVLKRESEVLFEKSFFPNGSAKKVLFSIYNWHDHEEKCPWLITKLLVVKQELFFILIYYKPFCYCNVGKQDCFVISCRKGCLRDGCLWLIKGSFWQITKTSKLIMKESVRKFHSISRCPRNTQRLIAENVQPFKIV